MKKKPSLTDTITIDNKKYTLMSVDKSEDGEIKEIPMRIAEFVADMQNGKFYRDRFMQRMPGQWSKVQRSNLILSILQNRPVGNIFVATGRIDDQNDQSYTKNALIDGLQRSTTISEFVNDEFRLNNKIKPIQCRFKANGKNGEIISHTFDITGKKFSQLPEVLRETILNYRLFLYSCTGFTDDELDELIFSLNSGKAPTSYQKMRFALGSENMRLIQPINESTFFEDLHGCRPQNDSVLCCTMRIIILNSCYAYNNLGTAEIMKFINDFEDNTTTAVISEVKELVENLAEIKFSMTDNEIEVFDACTVPHVVMNLKKFKAMKNPDGKTYLEFFRAFITSAEYQKFLTLCQSGSGGTQYSAENVDGRQSIIDGYLDEFLDCPLPQDTKTA